MYRISIVGYFFTIMVDHFLEQTMIVAIEEATFWELVPEKSGLCEEADRIYISSF